MKKYVWLNINTGKFSNSWDETDQKKFSSSDLIDAKKNTEWKMIEYTCFTDDKFEFYNRMKIVTNQPNP